MSAISNHYSIHQKWRCVPKQRGECKKNQYSHYKKINRNIRPTSTNTFSKTPYKNKGYQKAKKFWKTKNATNLLKSQNTPTAQMHQLFNEGRFKEAEKQLKAYLLGKIKLNERDFLTAVKLIVHSGKVSQYKEIVKKIEQSDIQPTVSLILAMTDMVCGPECHDTLTLIVKLKGKLNPSPLFTVKYPDSNIKSSILTLNNAIFKAAVIAQDIGQCLSTLHEMKKNGEPHYALAFSDFLSLCLAKEGGGAQLAISSYLNFWPEEFFLDEKVCLRMLREGIASKKAESVADLIVELGSRGVRMPYPDLFEALKVSEDLSSPENTEKILRYLRANAGFEHWLKLVHAYTRLGKATSAINAAASIWALRSAMRVDKSRLLEVLIDVCIEKKDFDTFFSFIRQFNIGQDGIVASDLRKIFTAVVEEGREDLLALVGWRLTRESGLIVINDLLKNKELSKMFAVLRFLDPKEHTFKMAFNYILTYYQEFFQVSDFLSRFFAFVKVNKIPQTYFSHRSLDELFYQAVNYGKLKQLWATQWYLDSRAYHELLNTLIEEGQYEGIFIFIEEFVNHPTYSTVVKCALAKVYEAAKSSYSTSLSRTGTRLEKLLDKDKGL